MNLLKLYCTFAAQKNKTYCFALILNLFQFIYMKTIKLKKGLNIEISGKASLHVASMSQPETVAIVPDDFKGITPKVAVKEGDTVKAGSVLFFDKTHPELKIVSPVSGTVAEVARGERRKLLYISVKRDIETTYEQFNKVDLNAKREEILSALLEAGFGGFFRQRPYDVIANPTIAPKAIFISAFDSAPLAPDYNFILKGQASQVQAGLSVLAKLTEGNVYYSVCPSTSAELRNMKGVEINEFVGAHPAGNVGVQINHLNPINKGEVVWTLNIQDVALIGRFATTGVVNLNKTIAVAGPEVIEPAYVKTVYGTSIAAITNCNITKGVKVRYINGDVLSGAQVAETGVLSPFANLVSVIAEGDTADEFIGWAMPRLNKFSNSNLFATKIIRKLFPKKQFEFDARILGGERAFIMSGELEKVFPMDIMPEQLLKAMITKNLDKMEQLGAYEVAPEDFGLCEFVCTSKMELQKIVRESLDYMRKELE